MFFYYDEKFIHGIEICYNKTLKENNYDRYIRT